MPRKDGTGPQGQGAGTGGQKGGCVGIKGRGKGRGAGQGACNRQRQGDLGGPSSRGKTGPQGGSSRDS